MVRKKKEQEDKQYELGLKEPWTNRFWNVKGSISRRFIKYEKESFFKQTYGIFTVVSAVLLNALIINYFNEVEPLLPAEIPFLNHYINLNNRLIISNQLAYLPTITILVSIMLIFLSIRIYKRKPYYSYLILTTLSLTLIGFLYNLISLSNQYI